MRAPRWIKSSFSFANSNCAEVAEDGGCVLVRNSRHPGGPALVFTPGEWSAFIAGVKAGEFDHIAPGADRGDAEAGL